ncbi:MAG: TonB-dependent receptor [Gammaproteobacteria bacterium]|nr:TonB-dependent receptor [Gammaproteobacteria bacterium]
MRYFYISLLLLMNMVCLKAETTNTTNTEIELLKEELEALKTVYEQKIIQLESRLQQVEKSAKKAQITAKRAEINLKRSQQVTKSENSFNPAFSIIFDGKYASYDNEQQLNEIPGFQMGGESANATEGFTVGHSELVMSANVDDMFYGQMTYALVAEEDETAIELEEAFIETIGLDAGWSIRGGRFFSDIGYLNSKHGHIQDFVDMPVVYRAMLGGNYFDDGIQVSWLAPTDIYSQFGIEVFKGDSFPSGGSSDDEFATWTAFMKFGGDWNVEHSWQAGFSLWKNDSLARQGGGHHHGSSEEVEEVASFVGDSELMLIDFVYKWAPNGNAEEQNFKLQFEYFNRDENGLIQMIGSDPFEQTTYYGKQKGYYLQGVYQFIPKWRVGMRYDFINSNNHGADEDVLQEAGLLSADDDFDKWTLMLDYSHSEFSRFRIQYSKEDLSDFSDNRLYLQYIMSIGSHGAHSY